MIVNDKIISYVLYQMRTVAEVRRKCNQLKMEEDLIDETIDYLIEAGYLNDENYAKKYVENAIRIKKSSANEIKIGLMRKGVAEDIIDKYVDVPQVYEFEEASCSELALKKYKTVGDVSKVKKFLLNKGYRYDVVSNAIDNLPDLEDNNY